MGIKFFLLSKDAQFRIISWLIRLARLDGEYFQFCMKCRIPYVTSSSYGNTEQCMLCSESSDYDPVRKEEHKKYMRDYQRDKREVE